MIHKILNQFMILIMFGLLNINSAYAIYNGTPEPDLNKYQFMVSVQIQQSGTWEHKCGGSIISPTMILTAGHCVVDEKANLFNPNVEKVVTRDDKSYFIKAIHLKNGFYFQTVPDSMFIIAENDLAILELNEPIAKVVTIKLPNIDDYSRYYLNSNAVIALGYGNYDQTQMPSYPLLRYGDMNISVLMWENYGNINFSNANQYLYPNAFVGAFSSIQGPTSHDSGSPLLFNDNGHLVIIGATSDSPNLINHFQSTAYTKIGAKDNIDWINHILNN